MNKITEEKIQISKSGALLYLKNPRFSMSALAEEADIKPDQMYEYFSNRRDVLDFFYEGLILEYKESILSIDAYDSFSLSEKLSNLALTILDLMDPYREFVRKTYTDLVVCSSRQTTYDNHFREELKAIYESDKNQSRLSSFLNRGPLYGAGTYNFHLLVRFWLKDESAGSQKTMEFIDKWTVFVEELHYSSILDRGFDVAKFIYYNSPFSNASKGTTS
jgi:AcrR family transcriptional regulator